MQLKREKEIGRVVKNSRTRDKSNISLVMNVMIDVCICSLHLKCCGGSKHLCFVCSICWQCTLNKFTVVEFVQVLMYTTNYRQNRKPIATNIDHILYI